MIYVYVLLSYTFPNIIQFTNEWIMHDLRTNVEAIFEANIRRFL